MSICVEKLSDDKKAKLVCKVLSGSFKTEDIDKGSIYYCDDCQDWEHYEIFQPCKMKKWFGSESDINNITDQFFGRFFGGQK